MKKYLLLSVGICLFFLSACTKEKDSFVPYPLDGDIDNLIDALTGEFSTFSFIPNESNTVTIDKISELKVEEPTFVVSDHTNITLSWLNAESAIGMELLKLPNYSNGKYLKPIYTFEVKLAQGSNQVEINMDSPIELRIEAEFNEQASLYFLSNEGWSSLGSQDLKYDVWVDLNGVEKSGFLVNIAQDGWYSVSTKVDLASETFSSFCIELSGEYTQGNTKSFVILENGIVVPMTRVMEQGTFCTTMNIPIDQPISVIAMSSLRKDRYEMFISQLLMENGLIVAPIMKEKSIDEIKSILENI